MTTAHPAWSGMLPVEDTALYVTDTGGTGLPVVYLNGAYADQSHWRRVITDQNAGAVGGLGNTVPHDRRRTIPAKEPA